MRLFVALMLLAGPAVGQGQQCAARDAVVAHLAEKYGEAVVGRGLAGPNAMMEVFASAGTGTWTVTVTRADGVMCMVASGQGYEAVVPPPAGTEG